jgi:hypothetical protein
MTTIDDLVKEQKTTNLLLKEILKRVDAMRNEQIAVNHRKDEPKEVKHGVLSHICSILPFKRL